MQGWLFSSFNNFGVVWPMLQVLLFHPCSKKFIKFYIHFNEQLIKPFNRYFDGISQPVLFWDFPLLLCLSQSNLSKPFCNIAIIAFIFSICEIVVSFHDHSINICGIIWFLFIIFEEKFFPGKLVPWFQMSLIFIWTKFNLDRVKWRNSFAFIQTKILQSKVKGYKL